SVIFNLLGHGNIIPNQCPRKLEPPHSWLPEIVIPRPALNAAGCWKKDYQSNVYPPAGQESSAENPEKSPF
ncbi:MAG: hypothetical protein SCI25_08885, partial [Desulfuromonadales bacterium]|nr:hypothetical protein [Desulfuromonadales bacterium]